MSAAAVFPFRAVAHAEAVMMSMMAMGTAVMLIVTVVNVVEK